jgi:protein TonB
MTVLPDFAEAKITPVIGGAENRRSQRSDCVLRAVALSAGSVLSFIFHGSVLATLLYLAEQKPGAVAPPTEAISLATARSEVLEAVSASETAEAISAASIDETAGEVDERAAVQSSKIEEVRTGRPVHDVASPEPETNENTPQPEGIEAVRGGLESERSAGIELQATELEIEAAEPVRQAPAQETPAKPKKHSKPNPNRERASERKQKGAASARAKTGTHARTGRISASSGSALNYAALVRARVAARKPGGNGGRGTVVVAFSVSRSGGLTSARISRSSGNSSLDGRVLAAVRSVGPFPPPPAGANLNFTMPFYFK